MSKKIYLIREYGGEYEDSWEAIRFAFLNKKNRDKKLKELNDSKNKMESYRDLWNEISEALDNIEYPEEYYKYCNCEIEGDQYDAIYENYTPSDSFERFKYWMTEMLPDIYNKYTEETWKNIYNYYEESSCQYGCLYTSYFDEQDVDIEDAEEN
jgi:hypothetical protein